MDFDDLERAWDDHDRRLASGIRLNVRQARSIVALEAAESANRPPGADIDYTMPVAVAQRQLGTRRIARIVRAPAALITDRWRGERLVEKFQAIVMRLLGRHRTLRG